MGNAIGVDLWLWIAFTVVVVGVMVLDLGVLHRKAHTVTMREAGLWTAVWIGLALAFNAALIWWRGPGPALDFLTGYLIEYSLSVDNIFVFVLLFAYFAVPAAYQHRLLFWGILGALVMRGAMIIAGAALIKQFHWIIYVFGAFLVITGVRMALDRGHQIDPAHNPVARLFRRIMPVTETFDGSRFLVRRGGVLMATPLLVVMVLIETTDLIFAVDSIPAIFAITTDPFIVYTSNVFAILGLRSLYFLLAGVMHRFHYLKVGLAVVLSFVGVKMLLTDLYPVPTLLSLGVIVLVLGGAIVASLLRPPTAATADESAAPTDHGRPPANAGGPAHGASAAE